jgi:hypothetical protein
LQLLGSAQRITGDFSNATVANRVMFQTSTVNGNTILGVIPNGTSVITGLRFEGSSAAADKAVAIIQLNASEFRIDSQVAGTASFLPMTFYTGGSKQAEITTAGLFQFNSGYGSVATAYGCRAWVNFNGTGTVAIRASGNVSSLADNGTGLYTINFTNAMSDVNFTVVGMTGNSTTGVANARSTRTTSSIQVNTVAFNVTSPFQFDFSEVYFAIFR